MQKIHIANSDKPVTIYNLNAIKETVENYQTKKETKI